jgi:hypothetical protein
MDLSEEDERRIGEWLLGGLDEGAALTEPAAVESAESAGPAEGAGRAWP